MEDQQSNLSRRSLLATLPAASIAVAVPAALAQSATDPALHEAIAACRAASARADEFDRTKLAPARAAWKAACEALPHFTSGHAFVSPTGAPIPFSTESEGIVAMARNLAADDGEFASCCRELASAADERERRMQRLKAELEIDKLEAESVRLRGQTTSALDAVARHPVETAAALVVKLEFLAAQGITQRPLDALLSDLHRITGTQAITA